MLTVPVVTVLSIVGLIVFFTHFLGWSPGIAGGMLAGAITTSASIAAATQAIAGLGLNGATEHIYNAYVLSTYSVTYIMGCLLPILVCTIVVPIIHHKTIQKGAEEEDHNQAGSNVEHKGKTDFLFFGVFIAIGFLLGSFHFALGSINISLGSGVGCVLSGLLLGFLNSKKPQFGNISDDVTAFLSTFGLSRACPIYP